MGPPVFPKKPVSPEVLCDRDLGSHELTPKTIVTGRSQAEAIALEQVERARDIDFGDNTHVLIAGESA